MDLSIIIVTWNNEDTIADCLNSILKNAECGLRNGIEVLVIDNQSSDGTVEEIQKVGAYGNTPLHLVQNSQNLGFAKATNQGLRRAGGRYLLLLNPDTVLLEGVLQKMLEWMEIRPEVGILAPQLLTPSGGRGVLQYAPTIQLSCRRFPTYGNIFWELTGIPQLFPRLSRWKMGYFDHRMEREVDQPMGACLLVRRDALVGAGFDPCKSGDAPTQENQFLDERFPIYLNDVDLCYRIKKMGWKIVFSPIGRVVHHEGVSTRKVKSRMILSLHRSMIHYFQKHNQNPILLPLLSFLLLTSAIIRIGISSPLSVFRQSNELRKNKGRGSRRL